MGERCAMCQWRAPARVPGDVLNLPGLDRSWPSRGFRLRAGKPPSAYRDAATLARGRCLEGTWPRPLTTCYAVSSRVHHVALVSGEGLTLHPRAELAEGALRAAIQIPAATFQKSSSRQSITGRLGEPGH